MSRFFIPENFTQEMIALNGEDGAAWIARLPAILADCERHWNITMQPPFAHLSFNYVAPAICLDGTVAIVKACAPHGEFPLQSEALRFFDGRGAPRLLAENRSDETMLLEGIEPGTLLNGMEDDEQATSIVATVMRQLWRPAPIEHPFPSVLDWGEGFVHMRQHYGGGCGPLPRALVEEAETLYAELCSSMHELVLLHGDLHHDNILAGRERWVAIDPKGVVGEPAYETGALLRNPLPGLLHREQPGRILARRVDQLAEELGIERARVRNWAVAQAMLSLWWGIEDFGIVYQDTLTCAELLAKINVT